MPILKNIEIGAVVTLALAVVALPFYLGQIDRTVEEQLQEINSLKKELKEIDLSAIGIEKKLIIQEIKELQSKIEKKLTTYEFKPLDQRVSTLERVENLRAIITKSQADKFCPGEAKAAHVPRLFFGKTGTEICASNNRKLKSCASVNFVFVTNENGSGSHVPHNKGCKEKVDIAWPWGSSFNVPNTLNIEWGHGNTWVVCCF